MDGQGKARTVFVQESALVDCPYDDVARRLEEDLDGVLGAAVQETSAGGLLRRKVSPPGWPDALGPSVFLRVGPVRRHPAGLLVAFSWESSGAPSLFPRLEADIEVVPSGTSETSLVLRGRYDPPAGPLGRRLDDLVLHRIALATIRSFLGTVRDRLDPGFDGRSAPGAARGTTH